MNVSDIQNETWFKTHSDTNTYSASDILAGMNMYNGQIIQKILKVQTTRNQNITNEYYNFVSTNGLAQGQVGFNGEYPFPPDLLRPLRVEVSYDGVTWLPCKQYDINAGNMTSEYTLVRLIPLSRPLLTQTTILIFQLHTFAILMILFSYDR